MAMAASTLPGQIRPDTPFGRALRYVASRPGVDAAVEVGSWNGRGTTECIVLGFRDRGDGRGHLWSLESDPALHAEALRSRRDDLAFVTLLRGRLPGSMMTLDEVRAHPLYKAECEGWYAGEARAFRAAPVLDPAATLPRRADMVVLDGGEFSTGADWQVLKALEPSVVALDDVRSMKCRDILASLLADPAWRLVGQGDEVNGWAILQQQLRDPA